MLDVITSNYKTLLKQTFDFILNLCYNKLTIKKEGIKMAMNLPKGKISFISKKEYEIQEAQSFELTESLKKVIKKQGELNEYEEWKDNTPSNVSNTIIDELEDYYSVLQESFIHYTNSFYSLFDKIFKNPLAIQLYDGKIVQLIDYDKKEGSFIFLNTEGEEEQIDLRGVEAIYVLISEGE